MFIFAGSYERFIFGFSASADCSEPQEVVKRYTFAAHKSGVKCLVASGPYVASGGSDDLIHMYDMKHERDLGVLMNPCDGAVPCLEFYTPEGRSVPSHMLSGSADGGINIWRCKDWQHLKVMRGHKASVNSLAVHHSGKLALSVARDRAIRMWNLTSGRVTYVAPLEAEAEEVTFLRSGDSYLLLSGNKITVHSTSGEGGLLATYTAPRRILCTAAQSDRLLLLGLEDGSVRVWDVRTSGVVGGWERAHSSRVRGMAILKEGAEDLPTSLVTASSDGSIKLWDTRRLGGSTGTSSDGAAAANCTAQVSTGARLTCLAAVDPDATAPVRGSKPPAGAAAETAAAAAGGPSKALAAKAKGKKGAAAAGAPAAQHAEDEDEDEGARQLQLRQGSKAQKGKGAGAATAAAQQGGRQQGKPAQKPTGQAPGKQQKQQAQQGGKKMPAGRQGGRGGGGGRVVDDDPGFEIVPADDNGGRDGQAQQQRSEQPGHRMAERGRKRRADEDEGGTDGDDGAAEERRGPGKAGPSGRGGPSKQPPQRSPGQRRPKEQGGKGRGMSAERGQQQQQPQRPAKKAKAAGGAPGGKFSGGKGGPAGTGRPGSANGAGSAAQGKAAKRLPKKGKGAPTKARG